MDLGIQNKVALVTAGSAGLGYAAAKALALEGARVAICGRNLDRLEQAAGELRGETGARILGVSADVSKPAELERLVKSIQNSWGPIQILVNNSGGPRPGGFESKSDEEWHGALDVTLMNVVRMIRLVLPGMKEEKWGRIVSITSSSTKEPVPNLLLSNSLRPAVHGMTKTLASELGPFGITINTVEPGYHKTSRLEELAQVQMEKEGIREEEAYARMARGVPIGRLGDPDELGAAVAFLCSSSASYITGTTLLVDGGRTLGTSY